ncbi:recombinase family protein [Roseibium album]|uniref:recombinase family protein n=1 Tax=Roseibium album TaxID=311410 RepID=UPI0032995D58
MRKLAYLRISTQEQRPDRQIDGLRGLCDELHIETLSAVSAKRPIFEHVLDSLMEGDALVVWDLDRAFRSTIDAITTAEELRNRNIGFQIVSLNIDTDTPHGEFAYTIMAAAAQFERRLLSKRTKEGLAAARSRGTRLGRRPKLTPCQVINAHSRLVNTMATTRALSLEYGVSIWTIRRAVAKYDSDFVN